MKNTRTVITFVIIMLSCTYTLRNSSSYERHELITFAKGVGHVIDAQEREQYDLFPGMKDYREAHFYETDSGGFKVEILTERGKFISVNRDVKAWQMLTDYFYQYDTQQYNRQEFEKKWKIVHYDMLGFPITQYEINKNIGHSCCICGAAGCGLVSLGLSALAIVVVAIASDSEEVNSTLFLTALIGGSTAGMATGCLFGNAKDREMAVNMIRQSRMPRPIEPLDNN
jgi:hypothetical protein